MLGSIIGGIFGGIGQGINQSMEWQHETNERREHEKWMTGESTAQRNWQSGENSAQRGWQSAENSSQRDWQSAENSANRDFQGQLQQNQFGENANQRTWQTGENAANRALQSSMQGNMFQQQDKMQRQQFEQQEKMAKLNAELRGYQTAGAGYGLNAAGGNVTINNNLMGFDSTSEKGTSTTGTGTSPETNPTRGLGYGDPRNQPTIKTSSGSVTVNDNSSSDGTSQMMTGQDTPIQGREIRSTGKAQGPPETQANTWLNNSILQASYNNKPGAVKSAFLNSKFPRSTPPAGVKPRSAVSTPIKTGGSGPSLPKA